MFNSGLEDVMFSLFLSKASHQFDSTIVCVHLANQTSFEIIDKELYFQMTFSLSSTSSTLEVYMKRKLLFVYFFFLLRM